MQSLPFGRRPQQLRHALTGGAPRGHDPLGPDRSFVFFGEIDLVRDQRFQLQHLAAQRLETPRQAAVELLQRAPALRRRPGVDEIRRRLGLEQVHLAVQHRAARELARLGGPGAGGGERGDRVGGHQQAAVGRALDQIVARVGVRAREADGEHVIDRVAGRGVVELGAEHGPGRLGVERREAARRDFERPAPGQPDQREGGPARGRGEGDDRIRQHRANYVFPCSRSRRLARKYCCGMLTRFCTV